ncbi:hypothetical protein KBD13_02560 [Patescibacteria group bacterium]|nr:hypothetical protein [Patescibacteria group bacterium]
MPLSAPFSPPRRPQRGLRRLPRAFELSAEDALQEMRIALAVLRRASASLDALIETSTYSSPRYRSW